MTQVLNKAPAVPILPKADQKVLDLDDPNFNHDTFDFVSYYYNEFPEERDMSEAIVHRETSDYLRFVLKYLFEQLGQKAIVASSLTVVKKGATTAPDVVVIPGVSLTDAQILALKGWKVEPPKRPAPLFALEVSSEENWEKDIDPKQNLERHRNLGTSIYAAFDPLDYWNIDTKLVMWEIDQSDQAKKVVMYEPDALGNIWVAALNSYLHYNGDTNELLLLDPDGRVRLTKLEDQARQANALARRLELENRQKQAQFDLEKQGLQADNQALSDQNKELEEQLEAELEAFEVKSDAWAADKQKLEVNNQKLEADNQKLQKQFEDEATKTQTLEEKVEAMQRLLDQNGINFTKS